MSTRPEARAIILSAFALSAAAIISVGGPIDPPAGSVASSYKTLSEVEPRTAINATNTPGDADSVFRIAQPGSYYLTGNVTGAAGKSGIEVAASNVTIDLNGFRMQGIAGSSLSGIRAPAAVSGLVVRNGQISGWGGSGIDASLANESAFEELMLASNGGDGLRVGRGARVRGCTATSNLLMGFRANSAGSFTACTSELNAQTGFLIRETSDGLGLTTLDGCVSISNSLMGFSVWSGGNLTGCRADQNGTDGIGIGQFGVIHACSATGNGGSGMITVARDGGSSIAGTSFTVSECTASENNAEGIYAFNGRSLVTHCVASSNTGNGIRVFLSTLVLNNSCCNNGLGTGDGAGILANAADNRIEGNNVIGNDRGIDVGSPGNLIIGNSASGNTSNYEIVANNVVGNIVQGALSTAISGSTGGAGIGTTNPWANLSY